MVDPVTATALATVGSSLIGGYFGNKAAKQDRAAQLEAQRMNMMPYMDARNYLTNMYSMGEDALNKQLDAGYYQGQNIAGFDPMQEAAINIMRGAGVGAGADATNFMNTGRGFANNYSNLYNLASQDMLGNAIDYASANTEPLLMAAMRDPYRQLTESTLPTIDRAASGSMNTNSSRAGVAEAIANRGFADRTADTAANIQNNLINRSMDAQQAQLSNMTAANKNLAGLYNLGFSQAGDAANMLNTGGGMLRGMDQAILDDERARYEGNRDFASNALAAYNAGILGRAPTSVNSISPAMANPMMGALSGAMAGFGFGQKYGSKIGDYFSNLGSTRQSQYIRPQNYSTGSTGGYDEFGI